MKLPFALSRGIHRFVMPAVLTLGFAAANAQSYFDPTGFFPSPEYRQQDPPVVTFSGPFGVILLRNLDVILTSGRIAPPNPGPATANFNVADSFELATNGGSFSTFSGTGTGAASIVFDHMSGTTEVFQTEMLALSLTGGPVLIRESPTLPSHGTFSRTPVNGGYMVDSFFDVFTELSIDGGQSWIPASSTTRIAGSPEPATLIAVGAGIWFAVLRKRRVARR